jgi:hypothetical protein
VGNTHSTFNFTYLLSTLINHLFFMKYLLLLLLILTPISVVACPSNTSRSEEITEQSELVYKYEVLGLNFATPLEFSEPIEVGLDAQQLLYPASSELGNETLRILIVRFSSEAQQNIQPEISLLEYVKGVFLGIPNLTGESKEREFLGQMVTGEVIMTDFPQKRELEIYLLELSNNDQVAIIFESSDNIATEIKEKMINSISTSLTTLRE